MTCAAAVAPKTLPGLLAAHARTRGDELALRVKRFGVWHELTWRDYYGQVHAVACKLRELGVKPGDHVAILSDNAAKFLHIS